MAKISEQSAFDRTWKLLEKIEDYKLNGIKLKDLIVKHLTETTDYVGTAGLFAKTIGDDPVFITLQTKPSNLHTKYLYGFISEHSNTKIVFNNEVYEYTYENDVWSEKKIPHPIKWEDVTSEFTVRKVFNIEEWLGKRILITTAGSTQIILTTRSVNDYFVEFYAEQTDMQENTPNNWHNSYYQIHHSSNVPNPLIPKLLRYEILRTRNADSTITSTSTNQLIIENITKIEREI